MRQPVVGLFPFFHDLAESTRLVRIAEQYRALGGRPVFFSHGGRYEALAAQAGLPVRRVEPVYTPAQVDDLMKYDRMEKFGDPFPAGWLLEHVHSECRAYARHGVSLVVTGFNLSCSLSARKAGVPLVWILSGTSYAPYFQAGLATLPDNFQKWFTRLLPARLIRRLTSRIVLHAKTGTRAFNTVAGQLGLPGFPSTLSPWTGDAYAGRPVIGIPMQFEQRYNIDILVRHGTAIRLSKNHFRERDLIVAVDTILRDYEGFRDRAAALAARLPAVDGARRGAQRIREIREIAETTAPP